MKVKKSVEYRMEVDVPKDVSKLQEWFDVSVYNGGVGS